MFQCLANVATRAKIELLDLALVLIRITGFLIDADDKNDSVPS